MLFQKIFFLFVASAAFCFGNAATPSSDTSNAPVENPLNPRVTFTYKGEKSRATAIAWSAFGTLAPVILGGSLTSMSDDATLPLILVLGGLAIGPSLGEFYAGSPNGGMVGTGVRAAGEFLFLFGFAHLAFDGSNTGAPLAILGLASYLGSTAYSFYNANASVKRYNSALRARAEWGGSPILIPGPEGSTRTGALAYLRF